MPAWTAEGTGHRMEAITRRPPGNRASSPHGPSPRDQSGGRGAELTLLFPIREEAGLDTVPQVSEIPVSDVIPEGETF